MNVRKQKKHKDDIWKKFLSIINNGQSCNQDAKYKYMRKAQRLSHRQKCKRSRAQTNGVGENLLNRKSMPLTHYGEGEEIVWTSCESVRIL